MEISDLIRSSGRAAWLVLVLPLVTGVAAGAFQAAQPAQFTSTATVNVPPSATGRTAAQYYRDFDAAMSSTRVVEATSEATGADRAAVRDGLDVRPTVEGSSILEVRWTGPGRDDAASIPEVAARAAFDLLTTPRIAALQAEANANQARTDEAVAVRDAFTAERDVDNPPQALQTARRQLNQATSSLAGATARGNAAAIATWRETLSAAEERVDALLPVVAQYETLQAEVQRTSAQLLATQKRVAAAEGELASIGAEGSISPGSADPVPSTRRIARAAVGGAVAGLLVAISLVAGLLALNRRRIPAQDEAADFLDWTRDVEPRGAPHRANESV